MKAKKICPRCHRLKNVREGERYCDGCLEQRAQDETPRRHKPQSPSEESK